MNKHGCYMGDNIKEIIDFSYNINICGIKDGLDKYLLSKISSITRYPEIDGLSAKNAICDFYGIDKKNCIMGNGAVELLYLFARVVNFKKVLIINPTFTEYERAFKILGTEIIWGNLKYEDNFELNICKFKELIYSDEIEGVIICNPNNPTGKYIDEENLVKMQTIANNKGMYFILDESFIEFAMDEVPKRKFEGEKWFVLRSLTKYYAVPGLRVGYAIGSETIIKKLLKHKEPWSLNTFAIEAIPFLLENREFYKKGNNQIIKNREYLLSKLRKLTNWHCFDSETNFILCKINENADKVIEYLFKNKIVVRTCDDFKGLDQSFIRLAIKDLDSINILLEVLKNYYI